MKKISIHQKKLGRFIHEKHGFLYRALHVAVLVGVIMAVNQAYAASGELLISGASNGKLSFGSADCTPIGEDIGTFTAPSDRSNRKREVATLGFETSDYKIMFSSKGLGLCGRAKNSQGVFWHHVGNNWSLTFKDVQVSCTKYEGDSLPIQIKVNLNGTLACTHNMNKD
ncbi:hypothetical protein [Halothiobacillus neapolitanus]|uniref:Uncharacterized protein n=1 Tax=Halothiobacillus neapolitanus (strain ATCC 23641 / DSM 15147 / CIP 104769 / NCIMB 8539 / c2) TaxID=555778 RepID=D0KX07_HALNC|nr:hypothetical protein [Halothiobacillus neapolitanus]ACX97127.1 hypothetical protein Hneap_2317 [Halothiobacillus neapolitanus c2]TDN60261.1 hypothetical protein C8D83_10416 [Halothiobacillus neapolitanus]